MSLRPPQNLLTSSRFETGQSVLEAELAAERAIALGRLGREAQAALAALDAARSSEGHPALVRAAAHAVWGYFVQRETCGLLDHAAVIAEYAIPAEVLARVGAMD